jgi:hypothetical protein
MTVSRMQASAAPRLMHEEQGTALLHRTFLFAHDKQLFGALWVVRSDSNGLGGVPSLINSAIVQLSHVTLRARQS